ncbi:hypothetical protein EC957_000192 [Mortierella hygrophila]|uniref:Transmembrane protein n=1 Tax=Mortierella hygrophila TaxID=979708 RepID=A0A9P6K7Z5_9FUNG|nr:hypothetical protein EC957_000192 [Mortierella hygrophila]
MNIPAYSKPCLVPAPAAGNNTVYLLGISPSQESTLVAHTVDITNINAPTANPFASQTNVLAWSSLQPLACYSYPGHTNPTTSPFLVVQFGAFTTHFTNIETSGIVGQSIYFPEVAFNSPKNFAINGAASGSDWVLAVTNTTVVGTNSYWAGIRFNATTLSSSNYNYGMSSSPTSNPLLTVGTYTVDSTLGVGYTTIFDYAGSAIMYNTTGSLSTIATPDERIISLNNNVTVAMSGIALTANAIPVTMKDTAYILDQGSDGSTIVHYLQPGKSSALNTLAIKGQVPRFSNLLTATALDTRIVTYSSYNNLSPTFNSLDTTTGTWSGPGLINSTIGGGGTSPYSPGGGDSSSSSGDGANGGGGDSKSLPIGAIVGGVVGGLVVIALVAFLFIRNQRQKNAVPVEPKPADTNTNSQDPNQHGSLMQVQHNYTQQQHQQQPQLYDPRQQYIYQQQQLQEQQQQGLYQISQQQQPYNHNQATSQQVYIPPQQQQVQQPQIFIGQQQHVYTPPTLIPQQRQPQVAQQEPSPVIYNHYNNAQSSSVQSVSVGSPANSNTLYSASNNTTGTEYPTSPTTPITAPLTLSTQALHEIQQLYKPPPANPQYTPDTQK